MLVGRSLSGQAIPMRGGGLSASVTSCTMTRSPTMIPHVVMIEALMPMASGFLLNGVAVVRIFKKFILRLI